MAKRKQSPVVTKTETIGGHQFELIVDLDGRSYIGRWIRGDCITGESSADAATADAAMVNARMNAHFTRRDP